MNVCINHPQIVDVWHTLFIIVAIFDSHEDRCLRICSAKWRRHSRVHRFRFLTSNNFFNDSVIHVYISLDSLIFDRVQDPCCLGGKRILYDIMISLSGE
jgi:hypothetical protein